jgi:Asp-tRNA(Asn)/Glu-tRNA(Gln) amidotransferase B subunit
MLVVQLAEFMALNTHYLITTVPEFHLIEIVTKIVPGTGKYAPEVARAYVAELRDILRGT